MNIFDIIDGVAFSKKENLVQQAEEKNNYQPYLINRWISMLDSSAAKIVNDTLNRYGHVFNADDQYTFLLKVLPRYKKQRINYIKRPSKEKA